MCTISGFITYVTASVTIYSVPLLSINRFVVFYYNHLETKFFSPTGTTLMITSTWIYPCVFFLPFLFTNSFGYEEFELQICGIKIQDSVWKIIYYHFSLVSTSISWATIVFCNVKVYQKLFNHVSTESQIEFKSVSVRATKEVLKLTVCYCICPTVFQLPAVVAKPWLTGNEWEGRVLSILFHFNSCLNPVLTVYFIKPFYRKFMKFFRRNHLVFPK